MLRHLVPLQQLVKFCLSALPGHRHSSTVWTCQPLATDRMHMLPLCLKGSFLRFSNGCFFVLRMSIWLLHRSLSCILYLTWVLPLSSISFSSLLTSWHWTQFVIMSFNGWFTFFFFCSPHWNLHSWKAGTVFDLFTISWTPSRNMAHNRKSIEIYWMIEWIKTRIKYNLRVHQ